MALQKLLEDSEDESVAFADGSVCRFPESAMIYSKMIDLGEQTG
jgi:hypothetical protein